MSDNTFTVAVLILNVRLSLEHEHHQNTVNTERGISVAHGKLNQKVYVPSLYSSAAQRVA